MYIKILCVHRKIAQQSVPKQSAVHCTDDVHINTPGCSAPGRLTKSAMLFGTALGSLALQAATRLPTYRILVGESILCMTSHGSCKTPHAYL